MEEQKANMLIPIATDAKTRLAGVFQFSLRFTLLLAGFVFIFGVFNATLKVLSFIRIVAMQKLTTLNLRFVLRLTI